MTSVIPLLRSATTPTEATEPERFSPVDLRAPYELAGSEAPLDGCHLVVADGEGARRDWIAAELRGLGFEVHVAPTAASALLCLARQACVALVSVDGLPDRAGAELAAEARASDPYLGIVLYSGRLADAAPAAGGDDAVPRARLLAHVVQSAARRAQRIVDDRGAHLPPHERKAARALTVAVVEALVNAMESKDVFLRGHSHRVAAMAAAIAHQMGMSAERVANVRIAGRLHDVGKIGVREAVLHKVGPLTTYELAHIREHVTIGMEILAPLAEMGEALDFIHHHHERLDGKGYPQGLAGDAISDGGRIIAVADAFDALTSYRPYRQPVHDSEALAVLRTLAGTTLDVAAVDALGVVLRRRVTPLHLGAHPAFNAVSPIEEQYL